MGLDILGGSRRGMSPLTMALLGLIAYRALKGKNLSDIFGGRGNAAGGSLGDLFKDGLGGLLGGGAAGSVLSGGLGDLLKLFQTNGQGDKAESWVSNDINKSVSVDELQRALGEERIAWLMRQTGISREELLRGSARNFHASLMNLEPVLKVLESAICCDSVYGSRIDDRRLPMWTKEARIQHVPRKERYPSDMTDMEWAIIAP